MNPALALCAHLRSPGLDRVALDPDGALEWWDGPVTAIARCEVCGGLGLLELLDWSRSRRVRVFALAAIEPAAFALYLRSRSRGSCDPSRAEREAEALFASAGPVERVVALDADRGAALASAPAPGLALPAAPWRERLPAESDDPWFASLGLEKATR